MPGHDLPLLTRKKYLGHEGYLISSVSPVASLTITDTTSLSNLAWNLRLTSDVSFHKYLQYTPNSLHGITLLLWIVQCLYVLNHTGCSNMWVTGLAWGPWELTGRWQWVPPLIPPLRLQGSSLVTGSEEQDAAFHCEIVQSLDSLFYLSFPVSLCLFLLSTSMKSSRHWVWSSSSRWLLWFSYSLKFITLTLSQWHYLHCSAAQ